MHYLSAQGTGDNQATTVTIPNRASTPARSFGRIKSIVATWDDSDPSATAPAQLSVLARAYDPGEDPDHIGQGYANWNGGAALVLAFVPAQGLVLDNLNIDFMGAVDITLDATANATGNVLVGWE